LSIRRLEINLKEVKMKATVVFLLLIGIVIIAIITSYNFGMAKSKQAVSEVKPITTSSQVILPQQEISNDKTQEIKLQQRLQEIEKEVAKRREIIIYNYSRREADFRSDAQARIAQLAAQEDAAKAKLEQGLANTQSDVSGGHTYGYIDQGGNINGYVSGQRVTTNVVGNPSREYKNEIRQIAKAKSDTSEDLQSTLVHLNAQKQYDLDELEKLRQKWIAGVVAGNYTSTPEADVITSSPSNLPISDALNTNVITGIAFSGDKSSAVLINGKIVYEGKCIGDIKVVSISKEEVEFEKNGKRWKQRVSEPPNLAWQE
jgi:membrane-associated HD superfamily phosphohydrolase